MPAHHPTPPCAAPHCTIRARHLPDCPQHDPTCTGRRCTADCCWGCLPRRAADGLRLCLTDTDRIGLDAAKLATLHADLQEVLVRQGHGAGARGSATGAPMPDPAVVAARAGIRAVLVDLVGLIVRERGVSRPVRHVGGRVYGDTRPAALAELVARHAQWLAAHPRAGDHADRLRQLAGDGRLWALAYPSASDRLYIGECPLLVSRVPDGEQPCGARLYQHTSLTLVTCAGCGTSDTIEQWRRWIVGPGPAAYASAAAIAQHLTLLWMRPVDPGTVRKWGQRSARTGVAPLVEPVPNRPPGPDGVVLMRPVRDGRGRVLLPVAACVAYATVQWAAPVRRGGRMAS